MLRWREGCPSCVQKETNTLLTQEIERQARWERSPNCEFQSKLGISLEIVKFSQNCEFQSKLWNSVEIVNFSQNCEFQSKLWISVEILNFSTNSEIQSKLLISVEIENFSQNCEFQLKIVNFSPSCEFLSKLWRSVKIQSIPFGVGLMRNRKISSRKYSFIKRTNPPSEIGL